MDKFSMGEINARSSEKWWSAHSYKINLLSGKSDDIMEMLLINDAAKRLHPDRERYLFMPYVPYGRQDRVMIPGEALGIKVLADLVNSCGFHEVEIWDPHSDVTTALLNNVKSISQEDLASATVPDLSNYALVSPDGGALKKIYNLAIINGNNVICASKHRDVKTGKITGTMIEDICLSSDKPLLIVDDICDGGYTFIALAKEIAKHCSNPVDLYVTHGIFSKGIDVMFDNTNIRHIYVANLIDKTISHDRLKCLKY